MKRWAIVALLAVAGCSDPVVSQVMLVVDADDRVRDQARSFVIRVAGGGREQADVTGCEDFNECQVYYEELPVDALPPQGLRVALAPDRDDWRRLYEASLTAYPEPNGRGEPLGTTRVLSGYVRGETRVIRLFLEGSCLGIDCTDPDLTCRGGECIDPFIPPETLDPFVPPDAGTDGGMDAPMCSTGADCDDGVECTFDDCVGGRCESSPRDELCASDRCQSSFCDSLLGCRDTPNPGATCNDDDICNGADACNDEGICENIGPPRCGELSCESDGTCTGCTQDDECPGEEACISGDCVCGADRPEPVEMSCSDGEDNDCDGAPDCLDPDCFRLNVEVCDLGRNDEDCDGEFNEGCIEMDCSDGTDDDADGDIDCLDDDCIDRACLRGGTSGFCSGVLSGCCAIARPETCGMSQDWNCDGISMSDCDGGLGDGSVPEGGFDGGTDADFDAGFDAGGPELICGDMIDGDGDGFVDCADEDCDGRPCMNGSDVGVCTCTPNGTGSCSPGDCFVLGTDGSVMAPDGSV